MFEDGIYVLPTKKTILLVWDDMAVGYAINWYGDMGEWEISYAPVQDGVPLDIAGVGDIAEAFTEVFGWRWKPDADESEHYAPDEIPFEPGTYPPISERHDWSTANILRDDSPMLDWAYEVGIVD